MGNATESDFNWVNARAQCAPATVFERLKLSLRVDADARTEILLRNHAAHGFTVISEGRAVSVFLQGSGVAPRSVVFEQTENGIRVSNASDKVMIEATLTLNDDRECRLKVGDKELELWQFRKLALESFFFDSPYRSPSAQ